MPHRLPAWQPQATYSDILYDAAEGIARPQALAAAASLEVDVPLGDQEQGRHRLPSPYDVLAGPIGTRADRRQQVDDRTGIDPGEESGNDRFRSRVHVHLGGAPLVIDVMADMSIRTSEGWLLYELAEIDDVEAVGRRFRAASLGDLRRFYRLAGRDKDASKIAALDAAIA